MIVLAVLLTLAAVLVAIPCLVPFIECLVALLPGADDPAPAEAPRPRTAVLIPAHDEELGIAPTITGLRAQLGPEDRLIVIAGNRSDGTPPPPPGGGLSSPGAVLRAAPPRGGNWVEAVGGGLESARAAPPPLHCRAVQVSSELPEGDDVALGQRRRWEHGQLATLLDYAP